MGERVARRILCAGTAAPGVVAVLLSIFPAPPVVAQDAVMSDGRLRGTESLRITAYPAVAFEGENAVGVVGRAAYGLGESLAVDARLGLYGDLLYFAAQAQLGAGEVGGFELTLGAGLHRSDFEGPIDVLGVDALLLAARPVSGDLRAYGALDLDFERPGAPFARFTRAHAVVGLEAPLLADLRALAEVGVGLNGASSHYFSAGLALSLR